MKFLVTGANGFIGRAICAEALARGVGVLGATRHQSQLPIGATSFMVGDIDANTGWQNALVGCDVVIHVAARVHVMNEYSENPLAEFRRVNAEGTERLARCAYAAGVKRLVYVSSIKVNGEETPHGKVFSEKDTFSPQDPYSISKWEAEQALHRITKETGLEVVIIRPPLVYGPGVWGNFAQMLRVVALGAPLPLASVRNKRDLVYLGNLVDALIACATHPNATGQTYLVSDGESVSTPALIRNLAKALGSRCLVFPFPIFILKFLANWIGKSATVDRLTQSLQIDISKIRNELAWTPPYTMEQGLTVTARWYLKGRHK